MAATVSAVDNAVSGLVTDGEIIEDTLDTHKRGLKNELKETKTALRKVKIAASREKWMIWGSLFFYNCGGVYHHKAYTCTYITFAFRHWHLSRW